MPDEKKSAPKAAAKAPPKDMVQRILDAAKQERVSLPPSLVEGLKTKVQTLRLSPADTNKILHEVARRFGRAEVDAHESVGHHRRPVDRRAGHPDDAADVPLRRGRRDERHARPPAAHRARGRAPRPVDADDDRPRRQEAQERPGRGRGDRAPDRGDDRPRRRRRSGPWSRISRSSSRPQAALMAKRAASSAPRSRARSSRTWTSACSSSGPARERGDPHVRDPPQGGRDLRRKTKSRQEELVEEMPFKKLLIASEEAKAIRIKGVTRHPPGADPPREGRVRDLHRGVEPRRGPRDPGRRRGPHHHQLGLRDLPRLRGRGGPRRADPRGEPHAGRAGPRGRHPAPHAGRATS